MPATIETRVLDHLPTPWQESVRTLVARARAADGVAPLNEEALLGLDSPGLHIVQLAEDQVIGYATLADRTAQLVVDPVRRRAGLGAQLAASLIAGASGNLSTTEPGTTEPGTIRGWWAFGDLPAAGHLAIGLGLVRVRELLKLERPIGEPTAPRIPDGVTVRSFVPGADEQAWLAVNARSFASHPEQGRMTEADLKARMAEPWFDPDGFLLAVDSEAPDTIWGFHWTKTEPDDSVGEVYVLGVDPDAAGRGLGGVLLDAGLVRLAAAGLTTVELYVEGDNVPALKLYRRAGFTTASTDVLYAAPDQPAPGRSTMEEDC